MKTKATRERHIQAIFDAIRREHQLSIEAAAARLLSESILMGDSWSAAKIEAEAKKIAEEAMSNGEDRPFSS